MELFLKERGLVLSAGKTRITHIDEGSDFLGQNLRKYDGKPLVKPVWLRLVYAGETKIRRHVKIRSEANPFSPDWQSYFAERAFQKKFGITRQQTGIKPL